jgi:preprotein translocase subunit SecG
MFTTIILVVHIIVCIALILIILLQTGKGADIGAVFGGGSSQTLFGSAGATPFLSKVTIGAAVVFMMTSIILTYFSGKSIHVEQSVVSGPAATEAPVIPTAPPETPQPAPEAGKPEAAAPATSPAPPEAQSTPVSPPTQPAAPAPATPSAEKPSGQK